MEKMGRTLQVLGKLGKLKKVMLLNYARSFSVADPTCHQAWLTTTSISIHIHIHIHILFLLNLSHTSVNLSCSDEERSRLDGPPFSVLRGSSPCH